nr:YigZ family protein [uncultured Stomatobaculum sp.]
MSETKLCTLLKGAQGEFEEKKSRFLSQSFCVRREEEVAEILAGLRKQHYDARHVCYAYILHGNPPVEKSSDDGEPAKTAGLPMLDLLRAASLRNTLITVVRYFGGTKLGTGGLVRAYTAAAKEALNASVTAEILPAVQLLLCLDYGFYGKVTRLAEDCAGTVLSLQFMETVSLCLLFREADSARFLSALTELSGGSVAPAKTETLFAVETDGKLCALSL